MKQLLVGAVSLSVVLLGMLQSAKGQESTETVYYMSTQLVYNRVEQSADGSEVVAEIFDGQNIGSIYVNQNTGHYSWAMPAEAAQGQMAPTSGNVEVDSVYIQGRSGPGYGGGGGGDYHQQSFNARRNAKKDEQSQAIWVIPIIVGAGLCYGNANVTVSRAHSHCGRMGRVVNMRSTGVCGMNASYTCQMR